MAPFLSHILTPGMGTIQGAGQVYLAGDVDTAELKGREFDVVVDTTGSQPGLDMATEIVKRGGDDQSFRLDQR